MAGNAPSEGLQLRSNVLAEGKLELSLINVPVPDPGPDEVIVEVQAAPINPSDLGLLFSGADMTTAEVSGAGATTVLTADIPPAFFQAMGARIDQPLPVGNEGAGEVVAAGSSDAAQALMGKTIAVLGRAMYGQFVCVSAAECLSLPDGTTAREGASCFVNPLTTLGFTETMRLENHKAIVHTAAASNLGQMLQKLCIADGIDLVNIVRKPAQVKILKNIGAKHVCDTSADSFREDLIDALAATGATIGFDATGGGTLASDILAAMEVAAGRTAEGFSRYGSTTYKQVYIYGGLERAPTTLNRAYGMSWGLGGWLLTPFMAKIGAEAAQKLRERVASEIKTTFASTYTAEVSLEEMLTTKAIGTYGRQATGEKYLVTPQK